MCYGGLRTIACTVYIVLRPSIICAVQLHTCMLTAMFYCVLHTAVICHYGNDTGYSTTV
jgi:hypothetical protein